MNSTDMDERVRGTNTQNLAGYPHGFGRGGLPLDEFNIVSKVRRMIDLVLEELPWLHPMLDKIGNDLLNEADLGASSGRLTIPVTLFPMKLGGWFRFVLSMRK